MIIHIFYIHGGKKEERTLSEYSGLPIHTPASAIHAEWRRTIFWPDANKTKKVESFAERWILWRAHSFQSECTAARIGEDSGASWSEALCG